MPDSRAIDAAIQTKLSSDVTLLSYMPDNVWFDEGPPKSTRLVIISLVDEADTQQFGGRAFEDALYMVKAVAWVPGADPAVGAAAATAVANAAARIDALLEGATLTVAGYSTMVVQRESRIRLTEPDDVDPTTRWYHRGGQYRVVMST